MFDTTIIPVELAQNNNELVSRSQARRVLARMEKFSMIGLNFDGVQSIGQAFADEIFRVFAKEHPNITIITYNTNEDVQKMINRAKFANI